jgi:hypothetical protein
MLLSLLILLPLFGIFMIFILNTEKNYLFSDTNDTLVKQNVGKDNEVNDKTLKVTALVVTVIDLFLSLVI